MKTYETDRGTVELAETTIKGEVALRIVFRCYYGSVWAFNKPAKDNAGSAKFMARVVEGLNQNRRPSYPNWTSLCSHCMTDGDDQCPACNYEPESDDGERAFERTQSLRDAGFMH